jgi:GNAT superfamily N-acetyltransferase
MSKNIYLRLATDTDIPVLQALIDASVRGLQAQDYTPAQIEGALQTVFGVDSQLIADGTYIVAEAKSDGMEPADPKFVKAEPVIVGCGGWSKRKTLYGGDRWTGRKDELLDPLRDAAKIRAFFIHPDWARKGIGGMILEACEEAARASGFTRYEMGATLTGAKLFAVKGYVAVKPISIPLMNGEVLPVLHMEKRA